MANTKRNVPTGANGQDVSGPEDTEQEKKDTPIIQPLDAPVNPPRRPIKAPKGVTLIFEGIPSDHCISRAITNILLRPYPGKGRRDATD